MIIDIYHGGHYKQHMNYQNDMRYYSDFGNHRGYTNFGNYKANYTDLGNYSGYTNFGNYSNYSDSATTTHIYTVQEQQREGGAGLRGPDRHPP